MSATMQQEDSRKVEKASRVSKAVNWQDEITAIAGPYDGNRKSWLSRAARRADVTYRQMKSLWCGQTTNPRHKTASSVLSAADQARLQEARRDAIQLAEIYHQRAEALAHVDADFHRPEIDALVTAARILGGRDST